MHTNLCGTPSKREGLQVTQSSPHRPYTDATDQPESSVRSFSTPQEVFIISRDIYNKAIADKKLLKALAFAISAKSLIRCSVAKHPTMKQLASLVGVSEYRAKRAIDTLIKYAYAEYDERGNFRFKRLKYKYNNIYLKGINTDSYQSAYIGLHAAAICDLIQKTEFVRQQFITKEKPLKRPTKAQKRRFNRAVRYCNQQGIHSLSDFSQNGYSYSLICKKYHFSKRDVSTAVRYGSEHNMFSAYNTFMVLDTYKDRTSALHALGFIKDGDITTGIKAKIIAVCGKISRKIDKKLEGAFLKYDKERRLWCVLLQCANEYVCPLGAVPSRDIFRVPKFV